MDKKRLLQLIPKSLFTLVVMIVLMGLQAAGAQTIYVSSTTGSNAFNGLSPTISGGNGPKQTLTGANGALSIAAAGSIISIEAGAYPENFDFIGVPSPLTVEVRAAGAVTVANFAGTSTFNPGAGDVINLNSGAGSVRVSGGAATYTTGTLNVGAGMLSYPNPVALTVTGGRAAGSSPAYSGAVTATYTFPAAGSAGTEIPASLNGGTLTVNGGFNTTFPAALSASTVTVNNTATTTFSGALSLTGNFTHNGNDVIAAGIGLTNGNFATSGAAGQTVTAGDVTYSQSLATGSFTNAAPSSVTVNSLTVTGFNNNSTNEVFPFAMSNGGTLVVNGVIIDTGLSDGNDVDTSVISFANTGTATFGGVFDIAGSLSNGAAGFVTFNANAAVAGAFDSFGVASPFGTALGSNTLTLTAGVLANDFDLGRITGASSQVNVTGANHVLGGNTAGSVTMSGSGDINGALVVGGMLNLLDDNDVNGSIDVAGAATLGNATGDVINFNGGAGVNDIDGLVTVGGTVTLVAGGAGNAIFGSGIVGSTGVLTIGNGSTLTMNGDLNTTNNGVFNANSASNSVADNATLAFAIARGTTATFTPGPNTVIDDFTLTGTGASGVATLNLGQSFAVDEDFITNANTSLNLGNFLIRHSGLTADALVNGNITTPTGQSGALSFENSTQTLAGLGDISNILINMPFAGNRLNVLGGTSIDFAGTLTLFNGGIDVNAGADISPEGPTAMVSRNTAGLVTTDVIGAGTFNGDGRSYMLDVFGGAAVAAGSEYAATGITDLTIRGAGTTYTTSLVAVVGNVNITSATANFNLAHNVTFTGTLANLGTINGPAFTITLTGNSLSHTSSGTIAPTLQVNSAGSTLTGSTTIGNPAMINAIIVGNNAGPADSFSLVSIQEINGAVTVNSDGNLNLGMFGTSGAGAPATGDEGTVDGAILVNNGGVLTLTSNVEADSAPVTVGTTGAAPVPTFNFNGFTLDLNLVLADFSATSNANLGTSGTLLSSAPGGAGTTIGTNLDGAVAPTSALPGLDVQAWTSLSSATRVVGNTNVDSPLDGGLSLTLSGTVRVNNTITNNVTIIGTNVALAGTEVLNGTLTINATTVNFTGDGNPDSFPDAWTINGLYTHTAGAVSFSGFDLNLNAGMTFTAGSYTATAATDSRTATTAGDFLVFNAGPLTIGATPLSVPNVQIGGAITVQPADTFTIRDFLWLTGANLDVDDHATTPGILNLGDGAGSFYVNAAGFVVTHQTALAADGVVNYGSEYPTATIEYSLATAATGDELAGAGTANTIGTLIVGGATAFRNLTVVTASTLVFDAPLAIEFPPLSPDNDQLRLAAGGNVFVGINNPFGTNEPFFAVAAHDFNVQFDGTATTTGSTGGAFTPFWQGGGVDPALDWWPNVTFATGGPVALHANRNAMNVTTTGAGSVLALGAFNLNVLRNVTTNAGPNSITTTGGTLWFNGGPTPQTLTGGLNLTRVTVNNIGGLTLVGGNLNTSGVASGAICAVPSNTLILMAGVITTGANRVIICHNSTTNQGFVRTTGGVYGNVQVTVNGIAAVPGGLLNPDRVEFPLVDQLSNDREFAITFNTPHMLNSMPTIVANQVDASPGGTNGLPISTTDLVGGAFQVGRYPAFHWNVNSVPTVSPSIDYDVEFRAAGYANFVGENIEHTRGIRRQAGSLSNFWILTSPTPADNDNFAVTATQPVIVGRNAVGAIGNDGVLFTFGLEQNFMAVNPAAVVLNAGQNVVINLAGVFSGGSPNPTAPTYAYAVSSGSAATATGAVAGNNLTVTGVAAGTTTITVTGTDAFGATATATVNVTVNSALAVGTPIASYARNVGAAPNVINASNVFTGGTAPRTIVGASSNPATASVAVTGTSVTVTHGVVGAATITLTATDATGAVVVSTFNVTVNAGLAVNAGVLVNKTLVQGTNDGGQTVVGVFAGGTGAYTYGATSGNTGVATVALAGTTVTATGVGPYVIVGGAVTADAAPATISVTATDGLGATATATYTVNVNPKPGNVNGTGPNPASASLTLNNFLGLQVLTPKQTIAANFNGDASVTPFDAALIFNAWLAGKREFVINPMAELAYGEVGVNGVNAVVPVRVTGEASEVVSFAYSAIVDPTVAKVTSVTSNVEGWTVAYSTLEDGTVQIGGYGLDALPADGIVATINVTLLNEGTEFALAGQASVNANAASEIGSVTVGELPENFSLLGNYPNPFNPSTTISFDLPASAEVTVQVFDMLGRQVLVLPAQTIQGGAKRSVQLNGSNLASGSYFYRVIAKMDSKTAVENGRMLLVK